MQPGDIYRHDAFYISEETGKPEAKYLLVLSTPPGDDIVVRLLTSRPHGRPEAPPCYHGRPYGGYFLGVPGPPLTEKTWIDLRPFDDLDPTEFRRREADGILVHVLSLPAGTLRAVIECVAGSDDTTRRQECHLRDTLAMLH